MSHTKFALALMAALIVSMPATAAVKKAAKKAAPAAAAGLAAPSDEQKVAAERVIYGNYACEFNQSVSIARDDKNPGYVRLAHGKQSWTMRPEVSSTGAVNMIDVKGVAKMLQIANKSMLLNMKTGQRMVDGCLSDGQKAAALNLSQ